MTLLQFTCIGGVFVGGGCPSGVYDHLAEHHAASCTDTPPISSIDHQNGIPLQWIL